MRITSTVFVGLALVASAPAFAGNLLANGSFESNFSSWTLGTTDGGPGPVVIPYGSTAGYPGGAFGEAVLPDTVSSISPDPVGTSLAYFSSDTANPHTLSQTISVVAGTLYNVGFDYYAPLNGIQNQNDATLSFTLGGIPIGTTLTAGSLSGTPAQTWINFKSSFTAAATGTQTLAFQFVGGGVTAADFGIDRVFVSAAPEPGTWSLMIVGFGAAGFALRRRRSADTAVAA